MTWMQLSGTDVGGSGGIENWPRFSACGLISSLGDANGNSL